MTVHDLRNEIRVAVGRYERIESTGFTKESLAAICDAVGYEINHENYPGKGEMRAGILWQVGVLDEPDPANAPQSFRKAELEVIHETVKN